MSDGFSRDSVSTIHHQNHRIHHRYRKISRKSKNRIITKVIPSDRKFKSTENETPEPPIDSDSTWPLDARLTAAAWPLISAVIVTVVLTARMHCGRRLTARRDFGSVGHFVFRVGLAHSLVPSLSSSSLGVC